MHFERSPAASPAERFPLAPWVQQGCISFVVTVVNKVTDMSATLAMLTIGVVPIREVLPLLTEHIREDQITHISLLGKMSREDVMEDYAVEPGEEAILTMLSDLQPAAVSRAKVERDLQAVIEVLDTQGYDVIILMSTAQIIGMRAHNAILLEPLRIIPPLVASIVDGHQVGVIVPMEELIAAQKIKWQVLENPPLYSLAHPLYSSDDELVAAGRELLERGADVIMLDCLGFYQHHRDLLQKALDVPVLLSNVLIARLASELLV
jgi:protein AroM